MDTGRQALNETQSLCGLLAYDAQGRVVWPAHDLRNLLRTQLKSRLMRHLSVTCRSDGERKVLFALTTAAHPAISTFEELLHHRRPPLELLRAAKDFAKLHLAGRQRNSPLPPEIALLLYYGGIIAASLRCAAWVTTLSADEVRRGLVRMLREPWVDERIKAMFREGLDHLRAGRHLWRA